ncbi:alkylated DNA repair dioxygenase AlkB [Stackebrandtia albiflava]|uniref:Alkylated DNA repair dioxygenase AlkB n=1 Tax=Stackebrandtia albiflava TaxID=406432 RepID=A0A562ULH7_9ACTN|nr:alpha-ketoglutarate-dependent dioxygenase AlkB [Stackebrandtia albiflava]TWJ06467.1 alkylated DNA repair dioxygenase AlkB [Stackebrandtia albiflava]
MTVPGLRYIPDWLPAAETARLLAAVDTAEWDDTLRRRVQHYGHRYDYGSRRVTTTRPAPPMPEWVTGVLDRLVSEGHMARPDQLIVNEYAPGQGISAHVDHVSGFGPVVASISTGSRCDMDFTHPGTGAKQTVTLDPGGLCLMTGEARYTWRHGIAARRTDPSRHGRIPRGRRVSLTFRTVAAG